MKRLARTLISIPVIAFTIFAVEVAPALAAGGNGLADPGNGSAPPGTSSTKINELVSWIAWIVFAGCLVGVLISAVKLAFERGGYGGGGQGHSQLMWALGACIIAGSASALVGALA